MWDSKIIYKLLDGESWEVLADQLVIDLLKYPQLQEKYAAVQVQLALDG